MKNLSTSYKFIFRGEKSCFPTEFLPQEGSSVQKPKTLVEVDESKDAESRHSGSTVIPENNPFPNVTPLLRITPPNRPDNEHSCW